LDGELRKLSARPGKQSVFYVETRRKNRQMKAKVYCSVWLFTASTCLIINKRKLSGKGSLNMHVKCPHPSTPNWQVPYKKWSFKYTNVGFPFMCFDWNCSVPSLAVMVQRDQCILFPVVFTSKFVNV
jgi:hypothetical protein